MEYLEWGHLTQIGGSLVALEAQEVLELWRNLVTLASALDVEILKDYIDNFNIEKLSQGLI